MANLQLPFCLNACWKCLRCLTCGYKYGSNCSCPPQKLRRNNSKAGYMVQFRSYWAPGQHKANDALLSWLRLTGQFTLPEGVETFNICGACVVKFYKDRKRGKPSKLWFECLQPLMLPLVDDDGRVLAISTATENILSPVVLQPVYSEEDDFNDVWSIFALWANVPTS